jgi:ABC-type cobalamin/Fe3+-siderophores transport system ATPase subunit
MRTIIETRLSDKGLFYGELFILRVIQLYEAIQTLKGVMLVGNACSGKTTLLKITIDVAKLLNKMEYNRR